MRRVNNTGQSVELSWCTHTHWAEHGNHDPGAFEDCNTKTVTVEPGGSINFDEAAANGDYIINLCDQRGLD